MLAINESIRVENERREKLLRLKSGLMQDLLTGRVAVVGFLNATEGRSDAA